MQRVRSNKRRGRKYVTQRMDPADARKLGAIADRERRSKTDQIGVVIEFYESHTASNGKSDSTNSVG